MGSPMETYLGGGMSVRGFLERVTCRGKTRCEGRRQFHRLGSRTADKGGS